MTLNEELKAITAAPDVAAKHNWPAFSTINGWCSISGMGRTAVYKAMSRSDLKAIKVGNRTLIDVEAGLAWLRGLPKAAIRLGRASA